MLYIETLFFWNLAFVPMFYLFFDYTIGFKDKYFFGSLIKVPVPEIEQS